MMTQKTMNSPLVSWLGSKFWMNTLCAGIQILTDGMMMSTARTESAGGVSFEVD